MSTIHERMSDKASLALGFAEKEALLLAVDLFRQVAREYEQSHYSLYPQDRDIIFENKALCECILCGAA